MRRLVGEMATRGASHGRSHAFLPSPFHVVRAVCSRADVLRVLRATSEKSRRLGVPLQLRSWGALRRGTRIHSHAMRLERLQREERAAALPLPLPMIHGPPSRLQQRQNVRVRSVRPSSEKNGSTSRLGCGSWAGRCCCCCCRRRRGRRCPLLPTRGWTTRRAAWLTPIVSSV